MSGPAAAQVKVSSHCHRAQDRSTITPAAIEADTKLVPSWYVGGRTAEDTYAFMTDVAGRIAHMTRPDPRQVEPQRRKRLESTRQRVGGPDHPEVLDPRQHPGELTGPSMPPRRCG